MLKCFKMKKYSPREAPISIGDLVNKYQSPKNDIQFKFEENKTYASLVDSCVHKTQ